MPLLYSPTFVLSSHGETPSLHSELDGEYVLTVGFLPGTDSTFDALRFVVLRKGKLLDHDVNVPVAYSTWTVVHVEKKGEYHFKGVSKGDGFDDLERTWIPEPEVGKSVSEMISGVIDGDLTGKTACSMLFDLLLHLEVELAGDEPWLGTYFPTFFRYYAQKLQRAKVNKVGSVMES